MSDFPTNDLDPMKHDINYYLALTIALPIAVVKGVWTAAKQLPTYVSAEVRSTINTFDEVRKTKKSGKTSRERRMERIHGNSRKH